MNSRSPSFINQYWRHGLIVVLAISLAIVGFKLRSAEVDMVRLEASLRDANAELQAQELRHSEAIQQLTNDLRRQEKDLAGIHRLRALVDGVRHLQEENVKLRAALAGSSGNALLAAENVTLKQKLRSKVEQSGQPPTVEEIFTLFPERVYTDQKMDNIAARIAAGATDAELLEEFGVGSKNPDVIRLLQKRAEGLKVDE